MNGYLESLAHWMDDILERRRMDGEILNQYRDHIYAHRVIGRLAVELSSAADDVPSLTVQERAAIRRAAVDISDVLNTIADREERLKKAVYEGGSN